MTTNAKVVFEIPKGAHVQRTLPEQEQGVLQGEVMDEIGADEVPQLPGDATHWTLPVKRTRFVKVGKDTFRVER